MTARKQARCDLERAGLLGILVALVTVEMRRTHHA
jgi:hypothetical protein